jgi:hypothetical protein
MPKDCRSRCEPAAMRGNQIHSKGRADPVPHELHQSHGCRFHLEQEFQVPGRVFSSSCSDYMAFRLRIEDGFESKLHKPGQLWYHEQSRVFAAYWQALYRGLLHVS